MNTESTQTPESLGSPYGSAVFAFEVWPEGKEEWARTINARTRGKAKSEYHREVSESWEIDYRLIRCRKIGKPVTSERFRHNARYRGMPDVECGQRVKVGDALGVIVGHNASANFDVLFDDDAPRYAGMTLNCHPQSVEIIQQNADVDLPDTAAQDSASK